MSQYRLIFDDSGQSETQKALLRDFASSFSTIPGEDIIWSSGLELTDNPYEVSAESSKRLNLRLLALQYLPRKYTIFFPGHFLPGSGMVPEDITSSISSDGYSGIASLDYFIANNGSDEIQRFNLFVQNTADYEERCNYNDFTVDNIPTWAGFEHGISCLKTSERPWYSSSCQLRQKWISKVRYLLDKNEITLELIAADIANGLLRPSVLDDLKHLEAGIPLLHPTMNTIDDLFIFPEIRLNTDQLALLHSRELQCRIESFSKKGTRNKIKHLKKYKHTKTKTRYLLQFQSFLKTASRLKHNQSLMLAKTRKNITRYLKSARRIARKSPHYIYKVYAVSLRPLVNLVLRK